MSYDLQVYSAKGADPAQLRELAEGSSSLHVLDLDESRGWYSIGRGARKQYCFTIDGPARVEPEDVPDEVTAVLLAPTHLFHVAVEGSAAADIPHAIRFCRRLAALLGGVVVDQQTEEVWAKGVSRLAEKPARDERVSVIDLNWYAEAKRVPDDFGARYISLCRATMPEALPRRFGEHEPLQAKLAEAGDDGFARAWREATSLLFFAASTPCIAGSMWAGPGEQRPRPIWRMGVQVHYQPFAEDVRWRDALRRLFLSVADAIPAFYASAEVTRGNIWTGRSMWSDANTEWAIMPARIDGWMGLPPYPTWWAWYGEPYQSLLHDRTAAGATSHKTGIFHELAEAPTNRDDLTRAFMRRKGLRRITEWVPPELLARVLPNERQVLPTPLARAATIPPALRG